MPRRYLTLWFPFLATDRLRREGRIPACGAQDESSGRPAPAEKPHVLVETLHNALRIVDCDPHAVRLGLTRGLTLADARARIPDLVALEAQPQADQVFLEALAAFCDRFTPLVALDPPHGLLLDVTGCAHLFGGEAALHDRIGTRLRHMGLSLRAALAGTPEAARALARFGAGGVVPPGTDEARVRELPVAALDIAAETVTALSRAGLKTLADLAERPSEALSARFGEEMATRLRRTLGREDRRITPLRSPPACMVERHFAEPLLDRQGLEEVVARLVTEAARVLEQRGEGGRAFEVSLFRSDGAVRRLMVETGRPSRDAGAILRLWRERVDTLADPLDPGFGFDAVRLAVPLCEPLDTHQPSLDGRAVEEEAVTDLLDRLVTRFGRARVLRFVAQDTHHPARAARALSAAAPAPALDHVALGRNRPNAKNVIDSKNSEHCSSEKPVPTFSRNALAWPVPERGEPPARPLQLFEPPQPIETLAEVPDGPPMRFRWRRVLHEIARAEGPERIAPEWWRDGPAEPMRDYYRVEDAQGRRFWLFRAGLYERGSAPPRWFLHGLFA